MTGRLSLVLVSLLLILGSGTSRAQSSKPLRKPSSATTSGPVAVLSGQQLRIGERPFVIRGVGYSPVPIGVDPTVTLPYGDYFTFDQRAIYLRDLPLLRALGANTVRLWGWNNTADHTHFLDAAYNGGVDPIFVIASFWIDPNANLADSNIRQQLRQNFRAMVRAHKSHPGILMWCVGNELNLSHAGQLPELFSLLDELALEAHLEEGPRHRLVTTALADLQLASTIASYESQVPHLDAWGANVYRGASFGSLFRDVEQASAKPLVILEYGIDAYDSGQCGEYELTGSQIPRQADFAESLWREIRSRATAPRRRGGCLGGTIMAWMDERWKGQFGQSPGCSASCPDPSAHLQGPCGYTNGAHPDGFSNEEWWGLMRTTPGSPDNVQPRAAYFRLQSIWQ